MKASDFYNDIEAVEDMTKYDLYVDDHGENHRHASESDPTPEAGDEYFGAQVMLPHGDQIISGQARRKKRDRLGNPQGVRKANPILDIRVYDVVFPNGEMTEYGANVIAKNMWAQCDLDGKQQALMDSIIDYSQSMTCLSLDSMRARRRPFRRRQRALLETLRALLDTRQTRELDSGSNTALLSPSWTTG
jgi:hypothetical protein